jgi:predicted permease
MSLMYTNCGFIGLPLLQVMFGKEGVFLVTGYISVFQIICWSYGVVMLKGKVTGKDLLNILLNPNMIAIFIGLPCYVTGFTLPDIILAPMQQIAAMNTPLAMLVVGASLAMNSFKDLFLSARGYFITIMHNIVYPVLFLIFGRLLLAKLGWPNDIVWLTVLVSTACPIGSTSPMFALRFGRDNTYASALLGLSTLVCIGTIPAILFANGLISF